MRRIIALLLAFCLMAISFAGCSQTGSLSEPETATEQIENFNPVKWEQCILKYENQEFKLPMSYSDFIAKTGFITREAKLSSGAESTVDMYPEDTNLDADNLDFHKICVINIKNETSDMAPLEDCVVTGITINSTGMADKAVEEKVKFEFPAELKWGLAANIADVLVQFDNSCISEEETNSNTLCYVKDNKNYKIVFDGDFIEEISIKS